MEETARIYQEADGSYDRPAPPTNKTSEWLEWKKSKRTACGVIMATAGELHAEIILRGKPYDMWTAIEAQHLQRNASLRHEAWMQFLVLRKKTKETYVDYYHRVESAQDQELHHVGGAVL